jgi:hypothetical protein
MDKSAFETGDKIIYIEYLNLPLRLTLGRKYKVLGFSGNRNKVLIKDDAGKEVLVLISRFKKEEL